MNTALLSIPATVSGVKTMAHGSLRITLDSQEGLSQEQLSKLMGLHDKLCWAVLAPEEHPVQPEDLLSLPKLEVEQGEKTPATRQRAVLFLLWKKLGKPGDYDTWYKAQIERYIEQVKERLN